MDKLYSPVRLWTPEDYTKVLDGDLWLSTLLMNRGTFDEEGIRVFHTLYTKGLQNKYLARMQSDDEMFVESFKFYAANDEEALKFWDTVMAERPLSLSEVVTTYREVEL